MDQEGQPGRSNASIPTDNCVLDVSNSHTASPAFVVPALKERVSAGRLQKHYSVLQEVVRRKRPEGRHHFSASLKFRWSVFRWELIHEFLQPLSLMYLIPLQGTSRSFNRRLWVLVLHACGAALWFCLAMCFFFPEEILVDGVYLEVSLMVLVSLIRAVTRATQYAFRSSKLRRVAKEQRLSDEELLNEDMIRGWFELPQTVAKEMIECSERGYVSDRRYFYMHGKSHGGLMGVSSCVKESQELLNDPSKQCHTKYFRVNQKRDAYIKVPVKVWVTQAVLSEGIHLFKKGYIHWSFRRLKNRLLRLVGAVLHSMLPMFVRLAFHQAPMGTHLVSQIVGGLSAGVTLLICYEFIMVYLSGLSFHFQRRFEWLKRAGDLIIQSRGIKRDNNLLTRTVSDSTPTEVVDSTPSKPLVSFARKPTPKSPLLQNQHRRISDLSADDSRLDAGASAAQSPPFSPCASPHSSPEISRRLLEHSFDFSDLAVASRSPSHTSTRTPPASPSFSRPRSTSMQDTAAMVKFEELRISLCLPENVCSWLQAWLWLWDIGEVFQKRLTVFFFLYFCLLVLVMVGMFARLIVSRTPSDSPEIVSLNLMILTVSGLVILLLCRAAYFGQEIRKVISLQIFWLNNHAVVIQNKLLTETLRQDRRSDMERLACGVELIKWTSRQLENIRDFFPVRLACLEIGMKTFSVVLTFGAITWTLTLAPWLAALSDP